jgi:hypothetical protein
MSLFLNAHISGQSPRPLTPMQDAFVQYLVRDGLSQTLAARRAGYRNAKDAGKHFFRSWRSRSFQRRCPAFSQCATKSAITLDRTLSSACSAATLAAFASSSDGGVPFMVARIDTLLDQPSIRAAFLAGLGQLKGGILAEPDLGRLAIQRRAIFLIEYL